MIDEVQHALLVLGQIQLGHYLVVALLLFILGVICCASHKNAVGILIGIELILNAAALNFVVFSRFVPNGAAGEVTAIFIIVLAVAEAAVALAIVLNLYKQFGSVDVDEADIMKG